MLPPDIISASVLVCERVLVEQDGVNSAIRIVDVFYIPFVSDDLEQKAIVQAHALIIVKSAAGHEAEHSLEVKLERPDGAIMDVTDKPYVIPFKAKVPNAPGGATMMVRLNLQPKTMGTYQLRAFVDQEEVASAPITLLRPQAESVN